MKTKKRFATLGLLVAIAAGCTSPTIPRLPPSDPDPPPGEEPPPTVAYADFLPQQWWA